VVAKAAYGSLLVELNSDKPGKFDGTREDFADKFGKVVVIGTRRN
jgi:hypothetical protein